MYLGIDVSKSTLDVVLLGLGATPRRSPHRVFGNSAKGHQELILWLAACGDLECAHGAHGGVA